MGDSGEERERVEDSGEERERVGDSGEDWLDLAEVNLLMDCGHDGLVLRTWFHEDVLSICRRESNERM